MELSDVLKNVQLIEFQIVADGVKVNRVDSEDMHKSHIFDLYQIGEFFCMGHALQSLSNVHECQNAKAS